MAEVFYFGVSSIVYETQLKTQRLGASPVCHMHSKRSLTTSSHIPGFHCVCGAPPLLLLKPYKTPIIQAGEFHPRNFYSKRHPRGAVFRFWRLLFPTLVRFNPLRSASTTAQTCVTFQRQASLGRTLLTSTHKQATYNQRDLELFHRNSSFLAVRGTILVLILPPTTPPNTIRASTRDKSLGLR